MMGFSRMTLQTPQINLTQSSVPCSQPTTNALTKWVKLKWVLMTYFVSKYISLVHCIYTHCWTSSLQGTSTNETHWGIQQESWDAHTIIIILVICTKSYLNHEVLLFPSQCYKDWSWPWYGPQNYQIANKTTRLSTGNETT